MAIKKVKKSKIKKTLPVETSLVDGKTGEVKKIDMELDFDKPKDEPDILFPGLEGKMLLVKVGDKTEDAKPGEIDIIEKNLKAMLDSHNIKCLLFVTHHAVEVQVIG